MWPFREASVETDARRRGITLLLHSTHLYKNLPAILESGVIDTAAGLIARHGRERAARYLHDPNRYEKYAVGLDYVNCSLTLPNVELLYRRSKGDWKADWVHFALELALLSRETTRFCAMSAAHDRGRHVGSGREGFRAMFTAEVEGATRSDLAQSIPTHPQAEVLVQHALPLERANSIIVAGEATAREIRRLCELHQRVLEVEVRPQLFVWPERMLQR
ncbi:DUF4433 domain-containing protein [candidate division KSB1 bacterium]|nr:DUF4433 domain-containing protein [candidate division KSB1 bacterium]